MAVTNTAVVNALRMCELPEKVASKGLIGSVTLLLANARYQKCALVQEEAERLGLAMLYLPGYSPNHNLNERLRRFIKRDALYGRYHPTFADFKAAIERTIADLGTKPKAPLKNLLTLNFHVFDDVSLLY